MGRRLVLHIGAHKTGSTSVQSFLYAHKNALLSQGWQLFCSTPQGGESSLGNANAWLTFTGTKQEFVPKINENLFLALSENNSDTILSSEELFWLYKNEDIEQFAKQISALFDDIILICYLRKQDEHLLSHYQQSFKIPRSSARLFYGNELRNVPRHQSHFTRYLDYNEKLSMWAKYLEGAEFIVKEYRRDKLLGKDVIQDFLSYCPFNIAPPQAKDVKLNASNNMVQTIVAQSLISVRADLYNDLGGPKLLTSPLFSYSKKPSLSFEEAQRIMRHYYASNRILTKFIPDLSDDWFQAQEDNFSTSENTDITVQDMQSALSALLTHIDNISIFEWMKIKLNKRLIKLGIRKGYS